MNIVELDSLSRYILEDINQKNYIEEVALKKNSKELVELLAQDCKSMGVVLHK